MGRLRWVPLDGRPPIDIAYQSDELGRLFFRLPQDAGFGVLEYDGVQVTGYFDPAALGDQEYCVRPYILERKEVDGGQEA